MGLHSSCQLPRRCPPPAPGAQAAGRRTRQQGGMNGPGAVAADMPITVETVSYAQGRCGKSALVAEFRPKS